PGAAPRVVNSDVDPLVPPVSPGDLASAPSALPGDAALSAPESADGIELLPLLHGGQPLNEFYNEVHGMVGADLVEGPGAAPVEPAPPAGMPPAPAAR